MVPELRALGLLTVLDLQPLAAYCEAYARWVAAEQAFARMAEKDQVTEVMMIKGSAGSPMQNPLVKIARCAAADMVHFAGRIWPHTEGAQLSLDSWSYQRAGKI